ncbi:unnamed protein product [marine sediment metagenome]|uniref:Uncharacterized protein n=1 Tax=marine sediment metagenome TaxID=412755 RepID=X0T9P1_9ZZZZ
MKYILKVNCWNDEGAEFWRGEGGVLWRQMAAAQGYFDDDEIIVDEEDLDILALCEGFETEPFAIIRSGEHS